jgi:hypothetical protein
MQKFLGVLSAVALLIAAHDIAIAFPVAVLKAAPGDDIVPTAQGCGPNRYRSRVGRAICMGVVPIQVAIGVPVGEMAAHPAIGLAPGVTAVTRRSTEGIRTGRGIRPHGHEDRPYLGGWARACAVCAAIEYVMAVEDAQDVSAARAYLENLLASPLVSP